MHALKLLMLCALPLSLYAMQKPPQKSPIELLVGAAGFGNIVGIKNQLHHANVNDLNSKGYSALGMAASNGQVESAKVLLDANANPNIKDRRNMTPLAWAVIIQDRSKKDNYESIVPLLIQRGARVDERVEEENLSILHLAARGGDEKIIRTILNAGGINFVNDTGSEKKGRTPIAEAVRASKEGVTHVTLDKEAITDFNDLRNKIPEALQELRQKNTNKLSTQEMVNVITLLRQAKANPHIADAVGKTPSYYVNNVLLIDENDRKALLAALGGNPAEPRIIQYQPANLSQAIKILDQVKTSIPEIAGKVIMLQHIITLAQENTPNKYDLLRIALAVLATTRDEIKNKYANRLATVDETLDKVRQILRDSALIISGKAAAPTQASSTIPKPITPVQTQLPPKPVLKPSEAPVYSVPTLYLIENKTPDEITAHIGATQAIKRGQIVPLQLPLENQYLIFEVGTGDNITWQIENRFSTITQIDGTSLKGQLAPGKYKLTIMPNNKAQLSILP